MLRILFVIIRDIRIIRGDFFISINENRDELLPSSARQRGEFFTTDSTDVTDFICFNLLICGGLLLSSLQRRNVSSAELYLITL